MPNQHLTKHGLGWVPLDWSGAVGPLFHHEDAPHVSLHSHRHAEEKRLRRHVTYMWALKKSTHLVWTVGCHQPNDALSCGQSFVATFPFGLKLGSGHLHSKCRSPPVEWAVPSWAWRKKGSHGPGFVFALHRLCGDEVWVQLTHQSYVAASWTWRKTVQSSSRRKPLNTVIGTIETGEASASGPGRRRFCCRVSCRVCRCGGSFSPFFDQRYIVVPYGQGGLSWRAILLLAFVWYHAEGNSHVFLGSVIPEVTDTDTPVWVRQDRARVGSLMVCAVHQLDDRTLLTHTIAAHIYILANSLHHGFLARLDAWLQVGSPSFATVCIDGTTMCLSTDSVSGSEDAKRLSHTCSSCAVATLAMPLTTWATDELENALWFHVRQDPSRWKSASRSRVPQSSESAPEMLSTREISSATWGSKPAWETEHGRSRSCAWACVGGRVRVPLWPRTCSRSCGLSMCQYIRLFHSFLFGILVERSSVFVMWYPWRRAGWRLFRPIEWICSSWSDLASLHWQPSTWLRVIRRCVFAAFPDPSALSVGSLVARKGSSAIFASNLVLHESARLAFTFSWCRARWANCHVFSSSRSERKM